MNTEWAPVVALSVIAVAVGATKVLRGPLGKALADRLAGRTGAAASVEGDRFQGEVDELKHRLAEVEERLDFAERLLAKTREAERLAPPR